jgi:hypothetical protein
MKDVAISLLAIGALSLPAGIARADWQFVAPMPTSRVYHAGAVAGDLWYVAEGIADDWSFPTEVDVYDPNSDQWTAVPGELSSGRNNGVAISSRVTGHVLFPGGQAPSELGSDVCDLASPSGVIGAPALGHTVFLHAGAFAAGKFIVTGGTNESYWFDDAETWEEGQASWEPAGTMPGGVRAGHTMAALSNGLDVLVIGGCQPSQSLAVVDLYKADTGEWSAAAPMNAARCSPQSVRLADGRVLVVGGVPTSIDVYNSVEVYDPAADKWTVAAPMSDKRFDHALGLLPDGRLIAVAGSNDSVHGELGALSSAEVYDPVANRWSRLPPLHDRRRWPTLAVLSDGVYVAGGDYATGTLATDVHVLASVERLSWADLTPANPDGGATDGGGPDAASLVTVAGDDGCSCESSGPGGGSASKAIVLCSLVALAWRHCGRKRRRGKEWRVPDAAR